MGLVRAVIVCAVLGLAESNFLKKAPGEIVLFNTSRALEPYISFTWRFADKDTEIFSINGSGKFPNPEYAERVTLFSNGSLELRKLTLDDSGTYVVHFTLTPVTGHAVLYSLEVLVPVSDVRVSASATDLIENTEKMNQSSVKLTCLATGTSLWYYWFNRTTSSSVTSSPVLILTNVSRYDGPFSCRASNGLSSSLSKDVSLNVSYGPDVKYVKADPSKDIYYEGSKLTLSCVVDSVPEAAITWSFNSDPLPVTGAELVLDPLTTEHGGLYHCEAFNSKTMIRKSSQPLAIKQPLSDGTIAGISIACILVALGTAGAIPHV